MTTHAAQRVVGTVWLVLACGLADDYAFAAQAEQAPVRASTVDETPPPTFRSGVDLVLVSAIVKDHRGRPVSGLEVTDFQVVDGDDVRPVKEFWSTDDAVLSVGVLLDVSGSMSVGGKIEQARATAGMVLARLAPGVDEHTVFAFDTRFRELLPFSTERRDVMESAGAITPFGATSLYDAIAEAARRLATRPTVHRAVVVVTDGIDTHSSLTGPEVSGIATAIDVPVYVLAIVSPLDLPDAPTATAATTTGAGRLRDLARWTGGGVQFASTPAEANHAASMLVRELRHQYVLAFESASAPGWRQIRVLVDGKRVTARAAYESSHPR